MAKLGDIDPTKVVFFMCDLQEKFAPSIECFDGVTKVAQRLSQTSKILNIPFIVTEQYPKGLGNTVSSIDISHAVQVFPKTKFSMVLPEVLDKLTTLFNGTLPAHVVLFGIEAHVCVQQTAIDLLAKGIDVHVVADATSSRFHMDRMFAFERLRHGGAIVTTSESVMFQLLGDKDNPNFKQVQALIKESPPDTGLTCKM